MPTAGKSHSEHAGDGSATGGDMPWGGLGARTARLPVAMALCREALGGLCAPPAPLRGRDGAECTEAGRKVPG